MKQLKHYQEEKIEQLKIISDMYFTTEESETIVFQAPTGSGKTFMMTNYMSEIVDESDLDLCFLWVSIGNGELHKQSMKSVKKEIDPKMKCSLLEKEFFGSRNKINKNEIVFLNWEKIRNKDRATGKFTNIVMKDKDTINFIEVLKNTRECGIKIILIIDESHSNASTERAKEIRDEIIKPFLTIEMSATPVLTEDMSTKISINPNKVIEEEMIKKEVIINDSIDEIDTNEITSERLILESAFKKREKLHSYYKKLKSNVNPLVLIQLPNSSAGEAKKDAVYEFLKEKNINDEKIAVWLSDEKINNDYETLNAIDSKVEFLIFKQAIDTGWDCPRAQILVKFRESNSIVFEIQTVGRILRMPEVKHYDIEELNKAYVYTNIKSIEIKKEVYNPNIIKTLYSKRSEQYRAISIKSYYRNRIDYGDVTSSYKLFFEKEFCKYFSIDFSENTSIDYDSCKSKMENKGMSFEMKKLDDILKDVQVSSTKIDGGLKIENANKINVTLGDKDLEMNFQLIALKNLNGFAPKRSIPNVTTAIIFAFRKYLNINPANGGISYIQNLVVNNSSIFAEIISKSILLYKDFHKEEVENKTQGRFDEQWEIPESKNYNPFTNKNIESQLSILQPLYMPTDKNGEVDKLELEFIKYLEKNKEYIEWFWKNGDEHMESNFGIKKDDGYTFQPDFIVMFKNGAIGIFDTKAVNFNENDNTEKSNSLYKYISEERFNGKNLIGGLVILDNGIFKYYSKAIYKTYKESPDSWIDFNTLLH